MPSPRMMFTFFNSCQLLHLDDMQLLIICTKGMKWGCFCSLNFDISLLLCVCFHSFDTVLFTEVCVHVQMHNLYWSYQRYGFVNVSYFRKNICRTVSWLQWHQWGFGWKQDQKIGCCVSTVFPGTCYGACQTLSVRENTCQTAHLHLPARFAVWSPANSLFIWRITSFIRRLL